MELISRSDRKRSRDVQNKGLPSPFKPLSLFYRLLQQAVAADLAPCKTMVEAAWAGTRTLKM